MFTQRILRLPQVIEVTGLSRSSIYAAMSQGGFPQSISLGARAVGWRSTEIEFWINSRAFK